MSYYYNVNRFKQLFSLSQFGLDIDCNYLSRRLFSSTSCQFVEKGPVIPLAHRNGEDKNWMPLLSQIVWKAYRPCSHNVIPIFSQRSVIGLHLRSLYKNQFPLGSTKCRRSGRCGSDTATLLSMLIPTSSTYTDRIVDFTWKYSSDTEQIKGNCTQ